MEILDLLTFRGGGTSQIEAIKERAGSVPDILDAIASDMYRWILLHLRNDYRLPIVGDVIVVGDSTFNDKILRVRGHLDGTQVDISMRINRCMCGCCAYYIKAISICVDDTTLIFYADGKDLRLRDFSAVDRMGTIAGITKFLIRFVRHFYIAMNVKVHQRVSIIIP